MAIITKIREKSGLAAAAIAISLILFILGSDLLAGGSLFGSNDQTVGEIAGEKILYPDFQAKLQAAIGNFQQGQQKAPTDQDMQQLRSQVWEQYINDIAYQKEFDALGITVSDEELTDMVQGKNIHPYIQQQFTNQQTGQFDKNQVVQFLKNLKTMPATNQQQWMDFEKNLRNSRIREKYNALLANSNYVTALEAKREHVAQASTTNAKFVYVPYSSIVDSTIKVTDSQLEDYMSAHSDRYKGFESRSMEYVVFNVQPTKADSADFYNQIKDLAKNLGAAANDSAFAAANSEGQAPTAWNLSDLPESIRENLATFNPGGVYGPFKDGDNYSILKYKGVAKDSLYTVRASHILFGFNGNTSDSAKAAARTRAQGVLAQIKTGADFAQMASMHGTDGTAQQGGDLGFFKNNGSMVKPFETAVFGYNGTGVLPNLVETDFGYHIIKVTEAKTNTKYRISLISKALNPSQQTRDEIYGKAEKFANENKNIEQFKATVKKEKLISLTANRVLEGATTINAMPNTREISQWAFSKGVEKGKVSNAFELGNNYLVAVITGSSSKDKPSVEDFRDELKFRVTAEQKAEKIMSKLESIKGSLEQIAQKYGAGALVETTENINLANGTFKTAGNDPSALGAAFGLKQGKKSKPIKGESGVFVVEGGLVNAAPAIADYNQYKTQLLNASKGRATYYAGEAIKDASNIVDNKAKFY
jgi:peptidyl-prolyl cis-trans isomerase D